MSVRNVEVDGVPIYGIIDKLELHEGQEVRIVDYKTGSANDRKVKGPTKSEPLGGNYWRQLHFYKLLYEAKDASGAKVPRGTISYLEPDAKGTFKNASIELTRKDSNFVKKLITETYQKIQQHEFYEGCGEAHCSWCNFVKENQTRDSFVDREIELLDDKKK
jgi:DNA helicase-2/ATP-dependent DNA helicase PcrA